jgi:lipopolysaccharide/colanic/teichoic acid biosynthesis glycosyltransferase
LPREVNQYSWTQHRRLSVKPGMTGLSQVRGRSDLSFKETLDLDLTYIDQWSLALVFRILINTIPAVLKGRGAY